MEKRQTQTNVVRNYKHKYKNVNFKYLKSINTTKIYAQINKVFVSKHLF